MLLKNNAIHAIIKEKRHATRKCGAQKEREVWHMFTAKIDNFGMITFFKDEVPVSVERINFEPWDDNETDHETYSVSFEYHGVRYNLANDVYDQENDVWYDAEDSIWLADEYLWYNRKENYWYDRETGEIIVESRSREEVLANDFSWCQIRSHEWLAELRAR